MANRVVARAIAWQVYGGLLGTAVIFAAMGELGWWSFFLYNSSFVNRPWTIGIHGFAAVCAIALWHYMRMRRSREQTLADAGEAADLEGRGPGFRIGPFAVKIEIAFFAIAALLGFLTGDLLRAGVFLVSATLAVLAHELGHAAAARRYGHVASIHMHMLGGTTLHFGTVLSRRANALIAFAGPAVGLVLGALFFALLFALEPRSERIRAMLQDAVFVNAGWAAMNLLPVLPLDGGQLLLASRRLAPAAHVISIVTAIVIAVVAFIVAPQPLSGMFFAMFALYNFAETSIGRRIGAKLERFEEKWR